MYIIVTAAQNWPAQLLLVDSSKDKNRVVKDTSQVKVVRHKRGSINRFNQIHVISYPVQVSGFEAHHGTAVNSKSSGARIFKAFKMLTIPSQYILTLMTYLANNFENFTFNNSLHGICPRRRIQLHRPVANIVSYLKVVQYTTTKFFNISPKCSADWKVDKQQFVQSLRNRLIEQSFNFIDKFFDYCVTAM